MTEVRRVKRLIGGERGVSGFVWSEVGHIGVRGETVSYLSPTTKRAIISIRPLISYLGVS